MKPSYFGPILTVARMMLLSAVLVLTALFVGVADAHANEGEGLGADEMTETPLQGDGAEVPDGGDLVAGQDERSPSGGSGALPVTSGGDDKKVASEVKIAKFGLSVLQARPAGEVTVDAQCLLGNEAAESLFVIFSYQAELESSSSREFAFDLVPDEADGRVHEKVVIPADAAVGKYRVTPMCTIADLVWADDEQGLIEYDFTVLGQPKTPTAVIPTGEPQQNELAETGGSKTTALLAAAGVFSSVGVMTLVLSRKRYISSV